MSVNLAAKKINILTINLNEIRKHDLCLNPTFKKGSLNEEEIKAV